MNRYLKKLVVFVFLLTVCLSVFQVGLSRAQSQFENLNEGVSELNIKGLPKANADNYRAQLARNVGSVIGWFLAFLGLIFMALLIYAGALWMSARQRSEDVEKAKEIIKTSLIGIIIIILAYVVSFFVIELIIRAQQPRR